eukprot:gene7387-8798_t
MANKLDEYDQLKVLGRGSFGEAWLVHRKKDSKPLVLKRIQTGPEVPEKEKESALKEMEVLQKFHHPHVVKYFDGFETDTLTCIVMEYCAHGCLQDLIASRKTQGLGGFPEDEAMDIGAQTACSLGKPGTGVLEVLARPLARLASQLLLGMAHVHHARVLHRDLKPANVFVGQHQMMKLGDFGIAKTLSSQSMAATVVGTPYYLSPEVCKGLAYNYKSDIW